MTQQTTIDLRRIDPTEWRRAFHDELDALGAQDAFVLVTNHEPTNILNGCRTECDPFQWQTLENGPSIWRIRISRLN